MSFSEFLSRHVRFGSSVPRAQREQITDALENIYGTDHGRQLLESERGLIEFRKFLDWNLHFVPTGYVFINTAVKLGYVSDRGTVVRATVEHVVAHELVHRILGYKDPPGELSSSVADVVGKTVRVTNKILDELREPIRVSYYNKGILELFDDGTELTFGRTIDTAVKLQPTTSDPIGTAFRDTRDLILGNSRGNELLGGGNDDFLYGLGGSDELNGHAGNDYLNGGSYSDKLFGGGNDDYLFGGKQGDELSGGADRDHLFGEDHNDKLFGQSGSDVLDGGLGSDAMRGGADNDFYIVERTGDEVIEAFGSGSDTVRFISTPGIRRADVYVSIKNVEYLHLDTPFSFTREVTQNEVGWVRLSSGNDKLEFHAAASRTNATVFELGGGADEVTIVPHGFRSFLAFNFKGASSNDSVDLSAFDIDGKVVGSTTASSGRWLLAPGATIFDPDAGEEGLSYTNTNPGWDVIDVDSVRWLATFNGLRSGNFDL